MTPRAHFETLFANLWREEALKQWAFPLSANQIVELAGKAFEQAAKDMVEDREAAFWNLEQERLAYAFVREQLKVAQAELAELKGRVA